MALERNARHLAQGSHRGFNLVHDVEAVASDSIICCRPR